MEPPLRVESEAVTIDYYVHVLSSERDYEDTEVARVPLEPTDEERTLPE